MAHSPAPVYLRGALNEPGNRKAPLPPPSVPVFPPRPPRKVKRPPPPKKKSFPSPSHGFLPPPGWARHPPLAPLWAATFHQDQRKKARGRTEPRVGFPPLPFSRKGPWVGGPATGPPPFHSPRSPIGGTRKTVPLVNNQARTPRGFPGRVPPMARPLLVLSPFRPPSRNPDRR